MNPLRWAKAEVLHIAWKRGRYTPPDRKVFEDEILRAIAADDGNQRILSVGVAWYTKLYSTPFTGKTFITLDVDESRAEYATTAHVVGDLRDLERHFAEPFDVILMNGVIGYGLDTADDVDRALRSSAARLRPGGLLVLGVNEEKPTHVDPAAVPAHALFAPAAFGPWSEGRVTIAIPFRERTHTFMFWRRR
ncbi:MAG: class I SAM-dependent methyltransferase [Labilithrix sp.]|nr:class I SAM-dependent methyltransferase [Labilithrix sp.]MCW5810092.1 class I SAM-dependent methyltransferase [Labilithrix sp.]